MKKLLIFLLPFLLSLSALAQQPGDGIRKAYPNNSTQTINRQLYYGFSRLVSADYDSLSTYVAGNRTFYQGKDWQATDSIGLATFPGVSELWNCLTCPSDGGGIDLSGYLQIANISTEFLRHVEDGLGNAWFRRPDPASPSGGYLSLRLDPNIIAFRAYVDSLFGTLGSGGGITRIASADSLGVIRVGAGLQIDSTTGILRTSGSLASSNNIFISPAGDDSNGARGNADRPFLTIAGAQGVYTAGDVIYVNPGVYTGQAQLGIFGETVQYNFAPGADVSFSGSIFSIFAGGVIIRGKGKLTGTGLLFNSSGTLDAEFDEINLTGAFSITFANIVRFKGRAINLGTGSYLELQHTSSGYFEIEAFTQLATTGCYIRDNGTITFANTHVISSSFWQIYQAFPNYTNFQIYRFINCQLELYDIGTSNGTGANNSFYGRIHFQNTTINNSHNGVVFRKFELGTEFWFDGVSINAATGYNSMNATLAGGFQHRPPFIRILSGGLKVNSRAVYDVTRPITNLTPYTDAIVDTVNTITPFASPLSNIVVTGSPVVVTNAGTTGQVPKKNSDGTVTWGTVSGGGGSGGNPDSLASHPAAYYLDRANHTGTQPESTVTNLTTDLSGKEPTITSGTSIQYWNGAKSFVNFGTSVRNAYVAQSLTLSNTAIVATDSVAIAFGKAQGQINTNASNIAAIGSVRVTITQSSHGFTAGKVLTHSGGVWAVADNTASSTASVIGVVESVTTNTFLLVKNGGTITLSSLTADTDYFLGTSGGYTATEPTTSGTVSKPVFRATSTTTAEVIIQRGVTN